MAAASPPSPAPPHLRNNNRYLKTDLKVTKNV